MDTLDNQSFNTTDGTLTPEMDREIASTYPWMRFVAIMQIVLLVILLLANVAMMAMTPFGGSSMGGVVGMLIAIVIIIFPILFLMQSGNAFKHYIATKDRTSLLVALMKQKAFWRYIGILLIIYLAIVVIMLIVALLAGGRMTGTF